MSDLIERQAAIDALEAKKDKSAKGDMGCFYNTIIQNDIDALKGLPSAQPEIIRCRDCKHQGTKNCVANVWATIFGVTVKDDFYCGLAERRAKNE